MLLGEIQVSDFVYFASMALYSASCVLSMSELDSVAIFNRIFDAIRIASLLFVLLKVFVAGVKYTRREIALYGTLLACSAATFAASGSFWLVALSIFLIGSKGIDFDAIVKMVLRAVLFATLLVFALYFTGIIDSSAFYTRDYITGLIVERKSLGFGYVNSVGRIGLCVFMCYLYLRFERFGLLQLIASIALALFLWLYVVTRTAAVIIIFGAMIAFFLHRINRKLLIRFCAIIALAGIAAGTVLPVVFQSESALFSIIDSMTSHRLYWAHWCLENYGITVFGQPIHTVSFEEAALVGVNAFFLDNTYIRLLLNYGLIATALFFVAYIAVIRKSLLCERVDITLLLSLMFISGIASFWPLIFPLGFPLMALSASIGSSHEHCSANLAVD